MSVHEVVEKDEAGALRATYVFSPGPKEDDNGRIDVVVSCVAMRLNPVHQVLSNILRCQNHRINTIKQ